MDSVRLRITSTGDLICDLVSSLQKSTPSIDTFQRFSKGQKHVLGTLLEP